MEAVLPCLVGDPVPPDALLTGIAVLTLLSGLSDDRPLLVVTDNVQWLDQGACSCLPALSPRTCTALTPGLASLAATSFATLSSTRASQRGSG